MLSSSCLTTSPATAMDGATLTAPLPHAYCTPTARLLHPLPHAYCAPHPLLHPLPHPSPLATPLATALAPPLPLRYAATVHAYCNALVVGGVVVGGVNTGRFRIVYDVDTARPDVRGETYTQPLSPNPNPNPYLPPKPTHTPSSSPNPNQARWISTPGRSYYYSHASCTYGPSTGLTLTRAASGMQTAVHMHMLRACTCCAHAHAARMHMLCTCCAHACYAHSMHMHMLCTCCAHAHAVHMHMLCTCCAHARVGICYARPSTRPTHAMHIHMLCIYTCHAYAHAMHMYQIPRTKYSTSHRPLYHAAGCEARFESDWPTGCWRIPAVQAVDPPHHPPLATHHLPRTTHHSLLTAHCPPLTAHCPPSP